MADITIHKNETPARQAAPTVEPFRMMRDLLRWDPFGEMTPLFTPGEPTFTPAFEVKETKDAYLFKADVPGVKEADIDVTVQGNRLIIAGSRSEEKEDKNETYYSCERRYGSFSRAYTLPEGADLNNVHADLRTGVLTVAVPKLPEVQPKKIAVKATPTKA